MSRCSPGRSAALAAAVAAVLGVPVARAGVEGTHHDMRLYNLQAEQSVCSYCHVPHRAASDDLLVRAGAHASELGRVGAFCYTCHDGTVVPTALVEAPDGTVGLDALTRSHGLVVANIGLKTGGLETPAHVQASGLVKLDPTTGALPARMECTACHDPHTNENAPFLVAPMAELCQRCHSGADRRGRGRFGAGTDSGGANGPHPVGMPVTYSGNDRRRPEQAAPEMVFGTVATILRVPGLVGADLGDPTKHWATGGHLADFGSNPKAGAVMCSTCHSAHSTTQNLLLLPAYQQTSASDPLCTGCHGEDAKPQNPGGTPYYHPVHGESALPYETSTAPRRGLDLVLPGGWPVAPNGALLCATCHRAHQGRPGTKCLRDNPQGKRYICDVCHVTDEDVSAENAHHMTSPSDRSAVLGGRSLSWNRGTGEPGDLTDGLTCIDCHTELAKSGHNW